MRNEKRLAARALVMGAFATLCHAYAVLFTVLENRHLPPYLLAHRFAPMLEHTVMSLTILILGGALISASIREKER